MWEGMITDGVLFSRDEEEGGARYCSRPVVLGGAARAGGAGIVSISPWPMYWSRAGQGMVSA